MPPAALAGAACEIGEAAPDGPEGAMAGLPRAPVRGYWR